MEPPGTAQSVPPDWEPRFGSGFENFLLEGSPNLGQRRRLSVASPPHAISLRTQYVTGTGGHRQKSPRFSS